MTDADHLLSEKPLRDHQPGNGPTTGRLPDGRPPDRHPDDPDQEGRPAAAGVTEFVVITGLSGAGRSTALKVLEDLGWFVIDNLPPSLISRVADLAEGGRRAAGDRGAEAPPATYGGMPVALGVPSRGGAYTTDVEELAAELEALRGKGLRVRTLFLEAADEVLVRRYEASRRRHPFPGERVVDSIAYERELMLALRATADLVIDTTDLNVHQLRDKIMAAFTHEGTAGLRVTVSSFGFKHGVPLDADMVVDVRFLPNPHWVPELRPKTGLDPAVRDHVLAQPDTGRFMQRLQGLLEVALPGYVKEGKQYLSVAIGCTGGRHRSVVLTQELAAWLDRQGYSVHVVHRDLAQD